MIISIFLVKFEPTTGKSKHILEVSRRLMDRGVTTHLITNKVKWNGPAEALAHLKIHELGGSTNSLYLRPEKVASVVRSVGADVFELHGGLSMTLFARSFAKKIPIPVVVNIHSQPSDLLKERRYLSWADWIHDRKYVADFDDLIGLTMKAIGLKRFVSHPNIKAVIVPSRQLAEKFHNISNVSYVPSGASLGSGPSVDSKRDDNYQTILFFGRAVMVRGIDTLIQAFSKLGVVRPYLRLELLLLDDVDLSRIRRLVKDSPWSTRIELTVGRQAGMDRRLAQATLAAFPFRSSGCIPEQPLTMIEAMAAALPVVTTPIGTVPEIVQDGQNGRIIPPADPKRLAQVIGELLDDSATRDRLGLAGQETVRSRFNWDTIADQTFRIYEQACKRA
jgi:glycosyltransferase involved in cell wall biosynthesis